MKNLIIALGIMGFALATNAQNDLTVYRKNGKKIEIKNAKVETRNNNVYITDENNKTKAYFKSSLDSIVEVKSGIRIRYEIPLKQAATSISNFHSEPQKGDNLITIVTDSNPEENFMNFGRYLVDKGFSFKSSNKDFYLIETNETTIRGGYKYRLSLSFKDSIIYIRPKYNAATLGAAVTMDFSADLIWMEWDYRTAKSDNRSKAYQKFIPILRAFGGEIYYSSVD